jgi:hypothetical protein
VRQRTGEDPSALAADQDHQAKIQACMARLDNDAGFCPDCEVPYCHQHWHLSDTGYGYCPYGHGKDLDPHWSPLRSLGHEYSSNFWHR